ncbi:MAG: AAA family ATPase [Thermodesulfobacteriota bacterium]
MYNGFFNFHEEPFSLTPDPRFIYLGPGHQEALEHMLYGVQQRKGFVLIAGHIGAGKTTLTRLLMDQLEGQVQTALIFNTFLNEIELLRAINREFGLPAEGTSREALLQVLNGFLIELLQKGGNAVLILDEAQNLSVPVLEQIRMLSNLETDNRKLLQIVLVGQPELVRTLSRPDLAQLDQRVTVRRYLSPLNREDTVRYIHHRLSVAGPRNLARFSPRAYRLIYRYSQGVPRNINALCDRALLAAYAQGGHLITPALVRQARAELTGPAWTGQANGRLSRIRPSRLIPAALIILGLILAIYLGYARTDGLFK